MTFPLLDCSEFGNFVITLILVTRRCTLKELKIDNPYSYVLDISLSWLGKDAAMKKSGGLEYFKQCKHSVKIALKYNFKVQDITCNSLKCRFD